MKTSFISNLAVQSAMRSTINSPGVAMYVLVLGFDDLQG